MGDYLCPEAGHDRQKSQRWREPMADHDKNPGF